MHKAVRIAKRMARSSRGKWRNRPKSPETRAEVCTQEKAMEDDKEEI